MKATNPLYPSAIALFTAAASALCPPAGPVLPPSHPHAFDPSHLSSRIDALVQDPNGPWNMSTTSFSLELTSPSETFFQRHHTAEVRGENGTDEVDSDTVYRVASVTKVFNVLTLLLNARAELDTPVARFVPELEGVAMYEDITLRMLAGSLSGVSRDGMAFDMYAMSGADLEEAGFPPAPAEDIPHCDGATGQLCTREEFFDTLLQTELAWLPADKGAYSNQAYMIIGFALEQITGRPFTELVEDSICKTLGMESTGFGAPELSDASIPLGVGELFMGKDVGNYKPTAGLYSTPHDLSIFVRSILSHTIMSPTHIREWLKPVAFAGSLSTAVGMPWEITRLTNITPDNRPIDVYAKLGSIQGYSAYIVVVPDYDIGASIIASGDGDDPDGVTLALFDMIAEVVIPEVDGVMRDEARELYVGHYNDADGEEGADSSISLLIDDGPGLKVGDWTNRGKSILEALANARMIPIEDLDARIYPVGQGERWHLALEQVGSGSVHISGPSGACSQWEKVDGLRYAGLPVDEFRFVVDDGAVVGIENAGLRASLGKQ